MTREAVRFAGSYDRLHAVRGLRLQLLPFVALAIGMALAALALIPVGVSMVLLLGACSAVTLYFALASYRRELDKVNRHPPQGSVTGELSTSGLVMQSEDGEESRNWSELARVQVFRSLMLLHNRDGTAVLLPAEFFQPGDWRDAQNIARGTDAARVGAIPASLRNAFVALCVALVLLYTLYLLSRAAA
jgi:hypothetical protein